MACTDCHDELLEGAVQHPPAAEQECETCHEISATDEGASVSLSAPLSELCVICHDTVAEELDRPRVHGAVEALGCTGCHDPHSSGFPRMLRVESNALCQACHLSAVSPEARQEGSVVILFGAHSVPSPVFSRFPKVNVYVQNGRGHPVAKHPVQAASNPLRPEEPLGCVSCHEPHGANREPLLVGPVGSGLCRLCHSK
jgi:predicted CXXCH cytochrome family protein